MQGGLCGQHRAVTEPAEQAGCSRQAVYDHAQRLVQLLAEQDQERQAWQAEKARWQAECDALHQQ